MGEFFGELLYLRAAAAVGVFGNQKSLFSPKSVNNCKLIIHVRDLCGKSFIEIISD